MASRVGEDLVDALNMMILLLPGTPVTYYGEEIGKVVWLILLLLLYHLRYMFKDVQMKHSAFQLLLILVQPSLWKTSVSFQSPSPNA